MPLETINALAQTAIGSLLVIAAIVFVYRFPENANAVRVLAGEIRQTAEAGVGRVEGANKILEGTVMTLMEAVKLLQESNSAAIASRERIEHRYEAVQADLATVKRDFEQQLAAKDAEIELLKGQIVALREADQDKSKTIEQLQKDLREALRARDDLKAQIGDLEKRLIAQEDKGSGTDDEPKTLAA